MLKFIMSLNTLMYLLYLSLHCSARCSPYFTVIIRKYSRKIKYSYKYL